jgi:hypothetical protein
MGTAGKPCRSRLCEGITTDLLFTSDKASKDTLTGELGTDWFWSAIAGAVADVTDKAVVERRRLV